MAKRWKLDLCISHCSLQAAEAEGRIDKFLETQCKEEAHQAQRAQVDQGYNDNFYISHFSLPLGVAL